MRSTLAGEMLSRTVAGSPNPTCAVGQGDSKYTNLLKHFLIATFQILSEVAKAQVHVNAVPAYESR